MSFLGVSNSNHSFHGRHELNLSSSTLNEYVYFTSLCRQEDKKKKGVTKSLVSSKINRKRKIRNTMCL